MSYFIGDNIGEYVITELIKGFVNYAYVGSLGDKRSKAFKEQEANKNFIRGKETQINAIAKEINYIAGFLSVFFYFNILEVCTKVGHDTIIPLRNITHHVEWEATVVRVVDVINQLFFTRITRYIVINIIQLVTTIGIEVERKVVCTTLTNNYLNVVAVSYTICTVVDVP